MSELLCYNLVDSNLDPVFKFPNLGKYEPSDARSCDVSNLYFKRNPPEYEERNKITEALQEATSGYKTLKDLKEEKNEKFKKIDKFVFKNFFNPLSKTKEDNMDRMMPIAYFGTLIIGIPLSFVLDSATGLVVSMVLPVFCEATRRKVIYDCKQDIEKINEKQKNIKTRFFSNLKEGKVNVNINNIFVESAANFVEKISDSDILPSVDFNKANEKLFKIYQDYASQPKV